MVSTTPVLVQFSESQQHALSHLVSFARSEQVKCAISSVLPLDPVREKHVESYLFALDGGTDQDVKVARSNLEPALLEKVDQILVDQLHQQCTDAIRGVNCNDRKSASYSAFMRLFLYQAQRYVSERHKKSSVNCITSLRHSLLRFGIDSSEALWSFLAEDPSKTHTPFSLRFPRCNELFGWFSQSISQDPSLASVPPTARPQRKSEKPDLNRLLGVLHQIYTSPEKPEALPMITLARNSLQMLSVLPVHVRGRLVADVMKEPRLASWWKSIMPNEQWPNFETKTTVYFTASPFFRRDTAMVFYTLLLEHITREAGSAVERERHAAGAKVKSDRSPAFAEQKEIAIAKIESINNEQSEPATEEQEERLSSECNETQPMLSVALTGLGLSENCSIDDIALDEMKWILRDKGYSTEQICLLDRFYYCAPAFKKKDQRPCVDMHYQAIHALKDSQVISTYLGAVKDAMQGDLTLSEQAFRVMFSTHCENERQVRHVADLLNHLQSHTVFVPWPLGNTWYLLPIRSEMYKREGAEGNLRWRKLLVLWLNELNHYRQDRFDTLLGRVHSSAGDTPLRYIVAGLLKKHRRVRVDALQEGEHKKVLFSFAEFISEPARDKLLTEATIIALKQLGPTRTHHVKAVVGAVFAPVKKASKADFVRYLQSKPALFYWRKHPKAGECVGLREPIKQREREKQLAA